MHILILRMQTGIRRRAVRCPFDGIVKSIYGNVRNEPELVQAAAQGTSMSNVKLVLSEKIFWKLPLHIR